MNIKQIRQLLRKRLPKETLIVEDAGRGRTSKEILGDSHVTLVTEYAPEIIICYSHDLLDRLVAICRLLRDDRGVSFKQFADNTSMAFIIKLEEI